MKNLYRTLVLFDVIAETEADVRRIIQEEVYSAHDELNGMKIHRVWFLDESEAVMGQEDA